MKQVIQTFKRRDAEERIPVVKFEIDYELATLYEALMTEDEKSVLETKERLEILRQELIRLEA